MKPTVTILVCVLTAGLALAQSPSIIQNTRNTMNTVSTHATAASNQALGTPQSTPAAASAAQAPAKSSGVAVVTPVKTSAAGVKNTGGAKRAPAVTVRRNAPPKPTVGATAATVAGNGAPGSGEGESEQQVAPNSKYNANGRRDPFISPVVSHAGGSGCSTGKKCLEIGAISLRGVVRAETGFIAVVSNGLNKAYFLRENDPVFNGYVVKITGDSIVFQETLQDRLGKTFTREVVKKITTPAV